MGTPHFTHPSGPEEGDHLIGAEAGAWCQGHGLQGTDEARL